MRYILRIGHVWKTVCKNFVVRLGSSRTNSLRKKLFGRKLFLVPLTNGAAVAQKNDFSLTCKSEKQGLDFCENKFTKTLVSALLSIGAKTFRQKLIGRPSKLMNITKAFQMLAPSKNWTFSYSMIILKKKHIELQLISTTAPWSYAAKIPGRTPTDFSCRNFKEC